MPQACRFSASRGPGTRQSESALVAASLAGSESATGVGSANAPQRQPAAGTERRTAIRRKLLVAGLSPSARLVGLQVEMAAHNLNGNKASATRAFKFNLKVDWEAQARNLIPSEFQFNRIQCN